MLVPYLYHKLHVLHVLHLQDLLTEHDLCSLAIEEVYDSDEGDEGKETKGTIQTRSGVADPDCVRTSGQGERSPEINRREPGSVASLEM